MLYFAPIETIEIVEKRYSFCFPLRNPLGKKFVGPSLPPRLTLTVERSRSLSIYKTSQKPYKTVRLDRLFEIVIFYPALTEIPLEDEFNSANRIRFGGRGNLGRFLRNRFLPLRESRGTEHPRIRSKG